MTRADQSPVSDTFGVRHHLLQDLLGFGHCSSHDLARGEDLVHDLDALAASSGGKIEIESLDEGREGAIFENLVKGAVLTVFKERVAPEQTRDVVAAFEEGVVAHTGEDVSSTDLAALVE